MESTTGLMPVMDARAFSEGGSFCEEGEEDKKPF